MQRVLVIGPGGAGKTTIARSIAQRTGLPLVHLDAFYWHAGWRATPNSEWDRIVAEMVARDGWIIDGNYGRTLPIRLAACDTVVFLDRSRSVCLWRLVRRRLQYALRGRPDLPDGCPERLTCEFVRWVWGYPTRRRPGILRQLAALDGQKSVVVLRDDASVGRFLSRLVPAAV
jgi:adenylate kinase family enzyme